MPKKNKLFGNLLKAGVNSIATCEGKTAVIIEGELGELINVSGFSIQRYKSGHIPPDINHLKILSEQIVHRGLMNQLWMKKFLRAGSYPNPEALIQELFPTIRENNTPKHNYDNLPAPSYSSFIMRSESFKKLVTGLNQRSAVVLLISLGGMGKTCLARELSGEVISKVKKYERIETPHFDSCVWISDSSQEGTTSLSSFLDEIVRTLNYSGFTKLTFDEKKREVENLLRCQKVLLVVDNLETIKDETLISWILSIPEPSKVIVTTREYNRLFRNNTFVVELSKMTDDEALSFCKAHLIQLGISEKIYDPETLLPLIKTTGGNPKALEISLGLIKYKHKTIEEVTHDVYEAKGEIFENLFSKCWGVLTSGQRMVLISMYLFPYGTEKNILAKIIDIQSFELEESLEVLSDMSLVDVSNESLQDKSLYKLHPLVRSFSRSKFHELDSTNIHLIRSKWINIFLGISENVGFAWDKVSKLEQLDQSWVLNTLEYVINWCYENKLYDDVVAITKNIRYFYYVRGLWDTKNNLIRAKAAKVINNKQEEFDALTYHINIASKQHNKKEVEKYLPQLEKQSLNDNLSESSLINFKHAKALYFLISKNYEEANILWKNNLSNEEISGHSLLANKRWHAICEYHAGNLDESRKLLNALLTESEKYNFKRGVLSANVYLSAIETAEEDYESALKRLNSSIKNADKIQDRTLVSQIYHIYGMIYFNKNDSKNSVKWLTKAKDEYEKIGNKNKIIEINSILEEAKTIHNNL